jgi:hypothetical protein
MGTHKKVLMEFEDRRDLESTCVHTYRTEAATPWRHRGFYHVTCLVGASGLDL